MVNITRLEWAREKAKKNLESLFEDKCDIYEYVKEKAAERLNSTQREACTC